MRIRLCLALVLLLALPAWADTLRVGSRVLATGDSAARVLELLGQPMHKARGSAARPKAATGRRKGGKAGKGNRAADKDTSTGERWQYRRGNRTVTVVLVEGRVTRIE